MTQTTGTQRSSEQADAIRPFKKVNVPEAELTQLRRRINATKWPERETVADATQGVQLATTQALASDRNYLTEEGRQHEHDHKRKTGCRSTTRIGGKGNRLLGAAEKRGVA